MQTRALDAEQETENAYRQIERLKKKQKKETSISISTPVYDMPIYDVEESNNYDKHELTMLPQPSSWFSGYDNCNI